MKAILLFLLAVAAYAQTGEIVVVGTPINGGAPGGANYPVSAAFDGDVYTAFSATSNGNTWIGIDAGAAVTLTRWWGMPMADGNPSTLFASFWPGQVLEASNSATFASGVVTLYTIPTWAASPPIFYPLEYTEVAVTPGAAYRYYRLRDSVRAGHVAEMRFIAQAQSGLTARPVPPVISPGSGSYLSGFLTLSMTSATTSATMHYTTNGSTPTCSSTTYSAPVTLTVSGNVTVSAVACDASLSTEASEASSQHYRNYAWTGGDLEWDDQGKGVRVYGGDIFYAEGKYWRMGINESWPGTNSSAVPSITPGWWTWYTDSIYEPRWKRANSGVAQVTPSLGYVHSERVHVIFNDATQKYVAWGDQTPDYDGVSFRAAVLTADHPQGPWTAVHTGLDPASVGFLDNAIGKGSDGAAYVVFAAHNNSALYVMRLTDDYTNTTGSPNILPSSNGREAPILFQRGTVWFLITSQSCLLGCSDTLVQYQTATDPLGTWSARANLPTQSTTGNSVHNGQCNGVVRIPGLRDAYLYWADRWVPTLRTNTLAGTTWYDLTATTPVLLPLVFPTSTTVQMPTGTDAPVPFSANYWKGGLFPMPGVVRIP
jgi:hypothetical protein